MFHVKHLQIPAESITGRIQEPWPNFVMSFALAAATERLSECCEFCANGGLSVREANRNSGSFLYSVLLLEAALFCFILHYFSLHLVLSRNGTRYDVAQRLRRSVVL